MYKSGDYNYYVWNLFPNYVTAQITHLLKWVRSITYQDNVYEVYS